MELVSFPLWDQTNVPDVQEKNHKVVKVTIPVAVDTVINSFFLTKNISNKKRKIMTKTSQEMKKLVEEFIRITNVKYEDQTEKIRKKSDLIDWQFHVGTNVIVNKNSNREDRVHVNVNMRFPPEDSKLLVSKNPSFSKAVMEISEICTTCKTGHQWIKDGENIGGLAIFSHIDEQNLDRISFHDVWDNVARVSSHVQKILRSNFSSFSSKNNLSEETMNKSMYG